MSVILSSDEALLPQSRLPPSSEASRLIGRRNGKQPIGADAMFVLPTPDVRLQPAEFTTSTRRINVGKYSN